MEQCWNANTGARQIGNTQENMPTSDIVRHDSHVGKSRERPYRKLNVGCLVVLDSREVGRQLKLVAHIGATYAEHWCIHCENKGLVASIFYSLYQLLSQLPTQSVITLNGWSKVESSCNVTRVFSRQAGSRLKMADETPSYLARDLLPNTEREIYKLCCSPLYTDVRKLRVGGVYDNCLMYVADCATCLVYKVKSDKPRASLPLMLRVGSGQLMHPDGLQHTPRHVGPPLRLCRGNEPLKQYTSWNHLVVCGAAAETSSTLLVDRVLNMNTVPASPAAANTPQSLLHITLLVAVVSCPAETLPFLSPSYLKKGISRDEGWGSATGISQRRCRSVQVFPTMFMNNIPHSVIAQIDNRTTDEVSATWHGRTKRAPISITDLVERNMLRETETCRVIDVMNEMEMPGFLWATLCPLSIFIMLLPHSRLRAAQISSLTHPSHLSTFHADKE
ncbi:hypothetical protein PR048_027225 [Dryococelus australis]|uniref:Uncharacterized protein n=1 Tax=Dryococelus australis TaxID=614101 RepID=A0ABQ9GEW0_9NEOP|nr:hypothetical protein PR048_027225 [Dryococelus australis]